MLSKYSVSKPYTVVVGIIMVILLGIISFFNTTTDLLPPMELPYVVVYTSYPGASAQKVEESLTKVLESSISTTANLTDMTSVSSDNLSMIILEFEQDTNMDSTMIELNAKIDLVEGYLDDSVSTPSLMAINPNMLPIMMTTVDKDNSDLAGLSEFVEDEVIKELEKTNGVASVDASGLLKQSVQVLLDQDKVNDINNKMLASIDGELASTERELLDNLNKVNDGLAKLDQAQDEVDKQKDESLNQLSTMSVELQNASANLIAMNSQIIQKEAEKAAFLATKAGYEKGLDAIVAKFIEAGLLDDGASYDDVFNKVDFFYGTYDSTLELLSTTNERLNAIKDKLLSNLDALAVESINEDDLAFLNGLGLGVDGNFINNVLVGIIDDLIAKNEALISSNMALKQLLDEAKVMDLKPQYQDILTKLNNVEIEIATSKGVKEQAEGLLNSAGIDTSDLNKLQAQIEEGKILAGSSLATGEMTISTSRASLESAKAQIEDGLNKLYESRDEVLKKANIASVITPGMISNILMAENFDMPAGYILSDDQSLLLKVGEEFNSIQELEDLVILSLDYPGLEEIKLRDIATVEIVDNSDELYTKVDGNDGVVLSFQKTSVSSTANVCKDLNKKFEQLEEKYEGLHFTNLMDQGIYIDTIISSVLDNFIYGAILAIIVLIIFLKDVKPTIVIGLSIPISLMFAFVLMYFSNVTLNIISLSGLALGVGMLVDNSVVVVENIYRMRNLGVDIKKASIDGASQVAKAIIASTLTTVCVFLPILFTKGLTRQLFVDMGLTIAYSLLASLIVALTLVPMLSSKLLKRHKQHNQGFYNHLVNGYEKALKWALKHKLIVMGSVIILLIVAIYGVFNMSMVLIPSVESNQMSISVTMKDSDMATEDVYRVYDEVMASIKDLDGVDTVGVSSNAQTMKNEEEISTVFYVVTSQDHKNPHLDDDIKDALEPLPIETTISTSNMDVSALGNSGIVINLHSNNLDDLQEASKIVQQQLQSVEGIDKTWDSIENPVKELRVIVDKNLAMKKGLTIAQVYQNVATKIKQEVSSTKLNIDNVEYPVIVVEDENNLLNQNTLKDTIITSNVNNDSVNVALKDIAIIEEGTGLTSVYRDNGVRYVSVNASIKEDYNISLVARNLDKVIDEDMLPTGVDVTFEGENETIVETMTQMLLMIVLAVLFIYLIMVAQFQSMLSPFIVMFTIPLAFTGGLLALLLTHQPLSIVAMVGFLVLSGVVVNNGIVFIDYINQLKSQGYDTYEAIILTGKTRLRPILMTALTTILAMLTMALGIGEGAQMMQSMAIVTIGGLSYATLLTLFVVPIMYTLLHRK